MNCVIETLQIGLNRIITFHHWEFSGMVGESHFSTTANLVTFGEANPLLKSSSSIVEELDYEKVKALYNSSKGLSRRERIKFWSNMKPMSPESIEEETERSYQSAISRVI